MNAKQPSRQGEGAKKSEEDVAPQMGHRLTQMKMQVHLI